MKTCQLCHELKPLTAFYNDRNKADGRATRCAVCICAGANAWYAEHRDYAKARMRAYYATTRDRKLLAGVTALVG